MRIIQSYKFVLVLVSLLIVILSSYLTSLNGGDFDVYLDAAEKLSNHQNIYKPPFHDGLQYYYSVFFALFLIPFSKSYFFTEFIWSILSYLLLYRIYFISIKYFDFKELLPKNKLILLLAVIFLSLQFIIYNVSLIQITIFLLWAIIESIDKIINGKFLIGGIILGLAINIKIMPILIWPYLFYRGYFKGLLISVSTILFLIFLPSIFIGNNYNFFLLKEWWGVINPNNKEHMFETGLGSHSLVSFIPVYITNTVGELPYKRNFINLSGETVDIIINLIRLFILSISIFYLRTFPFKKVEGGIRTFWEFSYFILIIPLLLPHQQKYAFLLALPMISYVSYYYVITFKLKKTFYDKLIFIIFVISMFFYSPFYGSDILGRFLFDLTQHFRILSISTLLLIPVSLFCSPINLKTKLLN